MFKTVRQGERAMLIDRNGRKRLVDGPQRVFVVGKEFSRLNRVSADQKEYIKVQYRSGVLEHIPGPCSLFFDHLTMSSLTSEKAITLDANEVVVVYSEVPEDGGLVTRKIQYGPTLFTPSANEWLHHFVWHGTDKDNKTRKIPGALQFSKLRVIPDQFYYNIHGVRTKDDALITVKLMIFYEIRNIETMLNQTSDPIADFINAVQADVISFASQLTYEEFMEASGRLNDLANYSQLLELSERIGYAVSKVVFRGYQAGDKLQRLHDQAIERRTNLKVETEAEHQKQDLIDSKLLNEQHRSVLQQELELDKEKHEHTLQKEKLQHALKLEEEQYVERIRRDTAKSLADIEAKRKLYHQQLAHLTELRKLGVDVTEYLISQHPKPTTTLRVVTTGNTGNFHIHP